MHPLKNSIDYLLFSIYDCKKPAWDGQDSCLRSHAQHFILCYIGSLVGKPLPLRFHATAPCRLWSGLLVTRLCARGYRGPPDLPFRFQKMPVSLPPAKSRLILVSRMTARAYSTLAFGSTFMNPGEPGMVSKKRLGRLVNSRPAARRGL